MNKIEEFHWDMPGKSDSHGYLLPSLERHIVALPDNNIIDIGCGNGYVANYVSKKFNVNISACDSSKSGLKIAKSNYPGVNFFEQDVSNFTRNEELQGKFDLSYSLEVIEHLLLPRKLLELMIFVTRPGGKIIISTPFHGYVKNLVIALFNGSDRHWHPDVDFGHVKFFSIKTLKNVIKEYEDLSLESVHRVGRFWPLSKSMIFVIRKI